jgi:MFS family permease
MLRHFGGDTVRLASAMGRASVVSALVGIFSNPVIASLADSCGRRPVLLMGTLFSMLRPGIWLVVPNELGLVIEAAVAPLAQVCQILPAQAGIADLFASDPVQMAQAQAYFFLVPAVCNIVCPVLGAVLTQRRVDLPFVVGVASALLSGVWAAAMPEPLASGRRSPFRWGEPECCCAPILTPRILGKRGGWGG